MEMKSYLRRAALAAGMFGLMALPMVVKADGVNMNVDLGGDDQAHYDFNAGMSHHHPKIWKAAQQLRNAKHTLWQARDDFHGHKADAIGAINAALDQLRICEHE
jgi:cytochrome c556